MPRTMTACSARPPSTSCLTSYQTTLTLNPRKNSLYMKQISIYTERLLSGDRIRLLVIQPAIDVYEPIECSCYSVALDQSPPYEALSYVWGISPPCSNICCNDERVTIRGSLYGALRRLRLSDAQRTIWADAICMNQSDNDEKSIQVALMGEVFARATRLLIWMGQGDPEEVRTAVDGVKTISNACKPFEGQPESFSRSRGMQSALPDELITPALCSSLRTLYGNPWFTRTWIIQELHKSCEALMLWGTETMAWNDVGITANWIGVLQFFQPFGDKEHIMRLHDVRSQRAATLYKKYLLLNQPLLTTLHAARQFSATDSRDKVYGNLSLVSPPEEATAIEVDYRKTKGEVFADTALAIIRLHSLLSPLSYVCHPYWYEPCSDLRSWAPNWSDRQHVPIVLSNHYKKCPWRPSLDHRVKDIDPQHLNTQKLCLTGIKYEEVAAMTPAMVFGEDYIPWYGSFHPFHKCIVELGDLPASKEEAERLRNHYLEGARTMLGGLGPKGYISSSTPSDDEELIALLVAMKLSTTTGQAPVFTERQQQLYAIAGHTCHERRVFYTRNFTIGLGPMCMQVGDVVVVLYGGQTPYVLRPLDDGKYAFMGEAYVDAIMDGELVREMERGERIEEEFCLV